LVLPPVVALQNHRAMTLPRAFAWRANSHASCNDRDLVARVEKLARNDASDAQVREAEQAVGIDPGGWSMAGQPLFMQHQRWTKHRSLSQ